MRKLYVSAKEWPFSDGILATAKQAGAAEIISITDARMLGLADAPGYVEVAEKIDTLPDLEGERAALLARLAARRFEASRTMQLQACLALETTLAKQIQGAGSLDELAKVDIAAGWS